MGWSSGVTDAQLEQFKGDLRRELSEFGILGFDPFPHYDSERTLTVLDYQMTGPVPTRSYYYRHMERLKRTIEDTVNKYKPAMSVKDIRIMVPKVTKSIDYYEYR